MSLTSDKLVADSFVPRSEKIIPRYHPSSLFAYVQSSSAQRIRRRWYPANPIGIQPSRTRSRPPTPLHIPLLARAPNQRSEHIWESVCSSGIRQQRPCCCCFTSLTNSRQGFFTHLNNLTSNIKVRLYIYITFKEPYCTGKFPVNTPCYTLSWMQDGGMRSVS